MDNKEFKKTLQVSLEKYGFEYKDKSYYYNSNDLILVISTQKSNYDDCVYVNYAFFVKELHVGVKYPKITEGDIRGRFRYEGTDTVKDSFPLAEMNFDRLYNSIEDNIIGILQPVISDGLYRYFEMFPQAINTATNNLKLYLKDQNI